MGRGRGRRWWRGWWWWCLRRRRRCDVERTARPATERSRRRRQRVPRAGLVDLGGAERRHAAHRRDRPPTGQGPATRIRPDRQRDAPGESRHRVPGGVESGHLYGGGDRSPGRSTRGLNAEAEMGRGRWRRWWRWRWWWWRRRRRRRDVERTARPAAERSRRRRQRVARAGLVDLGGAERRHAA